MRPAALALVVILGGCFERVPIRAGDGPRTIDAKRNAGSLFVPAKVNGLDRWCLLDTGATRSFVAASIAGAPAGDEIALDSFIVADVELSGGELSVIDDAPFEALMAGRDIGEDVRCDLGADLLAPFRTTIDYAGPRVQLLLQDDDEAPLKIEGAAGDAIVLDAPGETVAWTARITIDDELQTTGFIDTGTDPLVVDDDLFAQLSDPPPSEAGEVATPNGPEAARIGEGLSLQLEDARIDDVVFASFDVSDLAPLSRVVGSEVEAVVGATFLLRFGLVFDGPARRFELVPVDAATADARAEELRRGVGF